MAKEASAGGSNLLLQDALALAFAGNPDAVAIIQGDEVVRYGELDARADAIAASLVAATSEANPGIAVGVTATVTADVVAVLLGILRAGLAYVPLDVRSPPERLAQIVADAGLRALCIDPIAYPTYRDLLATSAVVDSVRTIVQVGAAPLHAPSGAKLLAWQDVVRTPRGAPPARRVLYDDLAYILYTSGSTGIPKGVMLTHRNARTFIDWMAKEFALTPADRIMSRSPLNFDLSVFDVFNSLAAGATLVIHDVRTASTASQSSEERHRAYVAAMRRHAATILYTTPSTFITLLDKGELDDRVSLRQIMYAGEPFRPALLRRLMQALPRTRVANIYGPTETNIVTYHWVASPPETDDPIPIGREVDDTEIVLVNDEGALSAPGESGEIWVRGGTVCIGYLGKDDLTRERLVDSPFHAYPAKFWRTGDYGIRLPDGEIAYHGRIDNMVKTRGHRVELGDIETALATISELTEAVVVPKPHARYGSSLHAFVVVRSGANVRREDIFRQLEGRLPAYMLPYEIHFRSELPHTSTGKADRQQLIRELDLTDPREAS